MNHCCVVIEERATPHNFTTNTINDEYVCGKAFGRNTKSVVATSLFAKELQVGGPCKSEGILRRKGQFNGGKPTPPHSISAIIRWLIFPCSEPGDGHLRRETIDRNRLPLANPTTPSMVSHHTQYPASKHHYLLFLPARPCTLLYPPISHSHLSPSPFLLFKSISPSLLGAEDDGSVGGGSLPASYLPSPLLYTVGDKNRCNSAPSFSLLGMQGCVVANQTHRHPWVWAGH